MERVGYFYPETLVADASDGVRLVDEGQFGPILPIIQFSDVDEAIRRANDSSPPPVRLVKGRSTYHEHAKGGENVFFWFAKFASAIRCLCNSAMLESTICLKKINKLYG